MSGELFVMWQRMNNMNYLLIPLRILLILFLLSSSLVLADKSDTPPRCIGNVCLGDHIEKYENKIEMVGKYHGFGSLTVLKNEGKYISAKSDEMDESNWVILSFCDSPNTIKTIHRTIKAEDYLEYYSLLTAYEKKYGKGQSRDYCKSIYALWYEWKWENPETGLLLIKRKNSNYISIELHSYDITNKDWECAEREILKMKTKEGLVPE